MRQITKASLWLALATMVATTGGCYRQARYQVVAQAPAALVRGYQKVYVEPMRLDELTLEGLTEATWIASRSWREQRLWLADRELIARQYHDRLERELSARGLQVVDAPGSDVLSIRPSLLELDRGFWAFAARDARARLRVDLAESLEPEPLDRIEVSDRLKSDLLFGTVSSASRMRALAKAMADLTGKYLNSRGVLASR